MKVYSVVENTSRQELAVEHGLSLFIERADGRRVLFDMGQGGLFAQNARLMGLAVDEVDVAVISHGHYDHGGGLATFLDENIKAKVYVHRDAFQPHYSLRENGLRFIGLNPGLEGSGRLVFCSGKTEIDGCMMLVGDVKGCALLPGGNRLLFGPDEQTADCFHHEQSLLIEEDGKRVLFAGCAHRGIVNIMEAVKEASGKVPTHVVAGFHLVKSGWPAAQEDAFIAQLAEKLLAYGCRYYTMHCTGMEAYEKLKPLMGNKISYLSCGEQVNI